MSGFKDERLKQNLGLFLCICFYGLSAFAQTSYWTPVDSGQIAASGARDIVASGPVYRINFSKVIADLERVPYEGSGEYGVFPLPDPDGQIHWFQVVLSPLMEPELGARFPHIIHLIASDPQGQGQGRITLTDKGFHAIIFSPKGTYYIDPYQRNDVEHHMIYFKKDYRRDVVFECRLLGEPEPLKSPLEPVGHELLIYRVAIAATGEYTQFHGGTVNDGIAAINVALARVTSIYERDLAIRMVLVANNDAIVFTDPSTDPYTNNDAGSMIGENQSTIDGLIGDSNYDIGHVFSTGVKGVAYLGVTCVSSFKAGGVTGLPSPVGDAFYVDYVAHEMGHQFGANHTFNGVQWSCGGGNRNASTAYEPGSGSTIMAYAGICGTQDLQAHSDDYFHGVSLDEIIQYTRNSSGNTCPTVQATGNTAPTVEAGASYTIPASTYFMLEGAASDPEGLYSLSYCWEEFDLGAASPPDTDDGTRPIFRSFNPSSTPVRIFPQLSDILNNTATYGESLPMTDRTLTMRLSVRDNQLNGGGVDFDTTTVSVVSSAGPFQVTSQNSPVTWVGSDQATITWDVAQTVLSPISCSHVDIMLSADGGLTFDHPVALGVVNDGNVLVTIPLVETLSGRIRVQGAGNIFFDINDAPITIELPAFPICPVTFELWRIPTGSTYVDDNANGVVDILEFLICTNPQ